MTRSPGIEALRLETRPGHCICCDGTVAQPRRGRPRIKCDAPECTKLYQQIYRIDRSAREREARAAREPAP